MKRSRSGFGYVATEREPVPPWKREAGFGSPGATRAVGQSRGNEHPGCVCAGLPACSMPEGTVGCGALECTVPSAYRTVSSRQFQSNTARAA